MGRQTLNRTAAIETTSPASILAMATEITETATVKKRKNMGA